MDGAHVEVSKTQFVQLCLDGFLDLVEGSGLLLVAHLVVNKELFSFSLSLCYLERSAPKVLLQCFSYHLVGTVLCGDIVVTDACGESQFDASLDLIDRSLVQRIPNPWDGYLVGILGTHRRRGYFDCHSGFIVVE